MGKCKGIDIILRRGKINYDAYKFMIGIAVVVVGCFFYMSSGGDTDEVNRRIEEVDYIRKAKLLIKKEIEI